ncbi:hypothetical protein RFI_17970, partial [Reticulomyxa filosa]
MLTISSLGWDASIAIPPLFIFNEILVQLKTRFQNIADFRITVENGQTCNNQQKWQHLITVRNIFSFYLRLAINIELFTEILIETGEKKEKWTYAFILSTAVKVMKTQSINGQYQSKREKKKVDKSFDIVKKKKEF